MIQIQISNVVNLESHFSCQYGAPDFTLFIRGEGEIREIYFFCALFSGSLFALLSLFPLAIVLCVRRRFTASD